ncbi:HAD family hydrolase [Alteromonas halophila]|uniref:Phosphatase n=1 Tax=Alteromonas halophila TaxID=516698 RepID=A0A918MX71_9ALTE|nr:HAD-IA family hydrolase [Alteromonas halophila]GGW78262.1 phosphatase [Alteromonas halophila]
MNLDGVHGVIFDLDGTLVESRLDFVKMRADVGCPPDDDILGFVEGLTCLTTQAQARQVILQHELDDAQTSRWLTNGKAMVEKAQDAGLPMAIVTRNCQQATRIKIHNNQIPIDTILTREDAPPKPDPTALLMVAKQWNLHPRHCLYVGDFIYDRHAAENAGMQWLMV